MLRILHILSSLDCGGIQTFLMNVYRAIDRDLIQFDFLIFTKKSCYYEEEISALGGIVYHFPSIKKNILINRNVLKKFFENNIDYSIVHLHVSDASYLRPLKIAKKYGVPVRIIHSHNANQKKFPHRFLHMYYKGQIQNYATNYFACAEQAAYWLYDEGIISENKWEFIPNAIDLSRFKFSHTAREKIRNEFKLGDSFVLGNVARFSRQKNHRIIIDIFIEVLRKEPSAKLLLVGEGLFEEQMKVLCAQKGLTDSVIFAGGRDDMPDIYSAMDVFLLPSLHEGLPLVLVEAQSIGLPCVVSSESAPKEVVLSSGLNFLSLKHPPSEWADLVLSSAECLPALSDSIKEFDAGFVARNLMYFYFEEMKMFDAKYIAPKLSDFYLEAIRRSS